MRLRKLFSRACAPLIPIASAAKAAKLNDLIYGPSEIAHVLNLAESYVVPYTVRATFRHHQHYPWSLGTSSLRSWAAPYTLITALLPRRFRLTVHDVRHHVVENVGLSWKSGNLL
jgi:hypothetical protein